MKIIFMGTPDFAAGVLDYIIKKQHKIVAVVTVPDKPAGRGQKLSSSPVKQLAISNNIPILQPTSLKDPTFLDDLASFNADLFVVVAFRMLPKVVWSMPSKGTFNLHASLLPQYRGAAPINHAVINGETISGVTTFFINENIDTGDIIDAVKVSINENDTAGDLHDRLMIVGAELVDKTLHDIELNRVKPKTQTIGENEILKPAPKIFKDYCRINLNQPGNVISNFVRGLSPYPAAYLELKNSLGNTLYLKIFKILIEKSDRSIPIGTTWTDGKSILKIKCLDSWVYIDELQQIGKKRMSIVEFMRGFRNISDFNQL